MQEFQIPSYTAFARIRNFAKVAAINRNTSFRISESNY
jgi:hypothetical protein